MLIKLNGVFTFEELQEVMTIADTQQTSDKFTSDTVLSCDEATYFITVEKDITTIQKGATNNITEIRLNDTKWLYIEVLEVDDDENDKFLIELHEKDNIETFRDSEHFVIKNNELIRI